jgi:hypothetical protein
MAVIRLMGTVLETTTMKAVMGVDVVSTVKMKMKLRASVGLAMENRDIECTGMSWRPMKDDGSFVRDHDALSLHHK